jgi:hypothetical protein
VWSFSSTFYVEVKKKSLVTLAPKECRTTVRKSHLPFSCGILGLYREQFDIFWATGHHATHTLSWHLAVSKVSIFYSMNSFVFMQFPNQNDCRIHALISGFDQIKRQNLSLQLLHTGVLVEIRTKAMLTLPNNSFCWHFSKKSFEYSFFWDVTLHHWVIES